MEEGRMRARIGSSSFACRLQIGFPGIRPDTETL